MSISKRLEEARKAYQKEDKEAAAAAHTAASIYANELHSGASSQYLGAMVYGGLDGILTTFAMVTGVAGAQLGPRIVLIMGLANLLADGFAMAIGAYLSSKSDQEYYQRERQREAWEVDNFPAGERAELFDIYRQKGYSEEETKSLVEIKTRNSQLWVDTMMLEELGMLKDETKPLYNALTTLVSFDLAGFVPLIVYILGLAFPIRPMVSFTVSLALSGLALFGLGAAKVRVTGRNALKSGLEMLLVGGLAAGVAYLVGTLLKGIGG